MNAEEQRVHDKAMDLVCSQGAEIERLRAVEAYAERLHDAAMLCILRVRQGLDTLPEPYKYLAPWKELTALGEVLATRHAALAKTPNPAGQVSAEASSPSGCEVTAEASGPVGLGPQPTICGTALAMSLPQAAPVEPLTGRLHELLAAYDRTNLDPDFETWERAAKDLARFVSDNRVAFHDAPRVEPFPPPCYLAAEDAVINLGGVYESENATPWIKSVVGRVIDELHKAMKAYDNKAPEEDKHD